MRQTAMDRWLETAEANRVYLIAQQRPARPVEQTALLSTPERKCIGGPE